MAVFARAARLLRHPDTEWRVIAAEPPVPAALAGYLLPHACLITFSWMAGLAMFGLFGARGEPATVLPAARIAHIGLVTFFGTLLTVALVAAAIWLIAPMYGVVRAWLRSLQVATYASTPLLLAGLLLLVPVLVLATVLAVVPALYHLHAGLRAGLGVKAGDATEYVAIVCLAVSVALTLVGGVAGGLGLI